MIEIKKATPKNTEILALLSRITYIESHGHYIKDKNDLNQYVNHAFSVSKIGQEIRDSQSLFHIIYVNELPVGYFKLVLNDNHKNVPSPDNCRLERIYVLNEFIPMKLGQQLLNNAEEKARELKLDTMWLSVYIENNRAIRFYQKNGFTSIGELDFMVNGSIYKNYVLLKNL